MKKTNAKTKKNIKKVDPIYELAGHLFELEIERMNEDDFEFEGWFEKFGANCFKFSDDFRIKKEDVIELSEIIKQDFDNGVWEVESKSGFDGLYNYYMPDEYGGFIYGCFEKQLAVLSGVGYQQKLFIENEDDE